MRSLTSFELELPADTIDEILREFEWRITLPGERGGKGEEGETRELSSEDWQEVMRDLPASSSHAEQADALRRQEDALLSQQAAERQLTYVTAENASGRSLLDAQHAATTAQAEAIRKDRERLAQELSGNGERPSQIPLEDFRAIAARQAKGILEIVAEEDKPYAYLTFRYPIFHRQTQTWGTVHYEEGHHRAVIRLRNPRPEKLKRAQLVENLVAGDRRARRPTRISRLWALVKYVLRSIWYEGGAKGKSPIVFDQIKVLERGSANEAFTGTVVIERSLESVIRERRGDLNVAGLFMVLGLSTILLSSPLVLDLDHRLQGQLNNGWLAWFAGNLGRLGSALFVAVFLPIIQVWLYWRSVRRQPSIAWSAD